MRPARTPPRAQTRTTVAPARTPVNQADLTTLVSTLAMAIDNSRRQPLEPYDGSGDVEDWMDEYEHRGQVAGWDDRALGRQLRGHLKGLALAWYQAAAKDQGLEELDWITLKGRVVEAFKPATYGYELRKQLKQDQGPEEPVLAFFEKRRKV